MNRISSATLVLCYIMSMSAMEQNTTTKIIFSHPQTKEVITTWQLSDEQLQQSSLLQDLKNAYPRQPLSVSLPEELLPAATHLSKLEPFLHPAHSQALSKIIEDISDIQGHAATQRLLNIANFLGAKSVVDVGLSVYSQHLLEHLKDHPTHFLDSKTPESYGVTLLNQELTEELRKNLIARLPFIIHRQTINGHGEDVNAVAFNPTHNLLASGSWDHTIKLWAPDAAGTYNLFQELRNKDQLHQTKALAYYPTQNILASGLDRTIKLWKANPTGQYQPLQTITKRNQGHADPVTTLAFHPTQNLLASGSDDNTIKLWVPDETELYRILQTIASRDQGHGCRIETLAFHPTQNLLASGSYDKTIKLWVPDATGLYRHHQTIRSQDQSYSYTVTTLAFHPTRELLASGSSDYRIKLWVPDATGIYEPLQTITICNQGHSDTVTTLVFHPTQNLLASGSKDKTIKLWVPDETGLYRILQTIDSQNQGHHEAVYTLAFHPTQNLLASGSHDNTIKLWSTLAQPSSSYAQALLIALAYERKAMNFPAINVSEYSKQLEERYDRLDNATKNALKLILFKSSNPAQKHTS